MFQFINRISEQVFIMICIIINIAYSTPSEDLNKCINQINMVFGNKNSATDCLKYAIEYYTIDDEFPISNESLSNEIRNIVSSNQSDFSQTQIVNNEVQNVASSSQRDSSSSQSYSNKIRKVSKPRIQVHSFEDLISSRSADKLRNVSNQRQNDTNQPQNDDTNQRQNNTNFAKLYHKALAGMIHGTGVPNRENFCEYFYANDYDECKDSLEPFGNTAKSAVQRAFESYKLATCKLLQHKNNEFVYIYKYMDVIIGTCKAKPSKRPWRFCGDLIHDRHFKALNVETFVVVNS